MAVTSSRGLQETFKRTCHAAGVRVIKEIRWQEGITSGLLARRDLHFLHLVRDPRAVIKVRPRDLPPRDLLE